MCFKGLCMIAFTAMVASSKATMVNQGREFVLAFPLHFTQSAYPKLLISKICPEDTKVTVMAPLDLHLLASTSYVLGATNGTLMLNFTEDLVLNTSDVSTRALHIVSDYDVIVSGISYLKTPSYNSFGAFLAFPVTSWSSSYVVVTSCEANACFILIICTQQSVTVKAKLAITSYVSATGTIPSLTFGQTSYTSGQTITQSLSGFQTMQLLAVALDMTGTLLKSTGAAIAVISGGAFTLFDSLGATNDHAVEQIPPLSSLGTTYVVSAFPQVSKATIVKVTYTDPTTSLTYNTAVMAVFRNNSYFAEFNLTTGSSTVLCASLPVLVTMFTRSGRGERFDPSAVTLNPVSSWATTYMAVVTNMREEVFYVSIATFTNCSGVFYLNGEPLSSLTWAPDSSGMYQSSSYELSAPGENVLHNGGCKFSGYVIGAAVNLALALPLAVVNLPPSQSLAAPGSSLMMSSSSTVDVKTSEVLLTSEMTLASPSHLTLSTSGAGYTAITPEAVFSSVGPVATDRTQDSTPGQSSEYTDLTSEYIDLTSEYTDLTSEYTYLTIRSNVASHLISTQASSSIFEDIQPSQTTSVSPYQPSQTTSASPYHVHTTFTNSETIVLPTAVTPSFTPDGVGTPETVTTSPTSSQLITTVISSPVGPTGTTPTARPTGQCPCACSARSSLTPSGSSDAVKRALRDRILRDLSLISTNLSSSLRRKISSENLTVSSQYLGGFTSIPVFCVVCCLMMLSDVCSLAKYVCVFVRDTFR